MHVPPRSPLPFAGPPLAALLIMSAACTAEPGDEAAGDPTDTDARTIVMDEMVFEPDAIEVERGAPVTLELVNEGGINHDLAFEDHASLLVHPGGTTRFEAGPFEDDVVGWCTVPGHRDAGMELTVRVVD